MALVEDDEVRRKWSNADARQAHDGRSRRWRECQTRERAKAKAWQQTDYVFTYQDGRPLDPRWVSRLFRRAVKKAAEEWAPVPFPSLSIHGLRHTYATLALQAGVDIKIVSANLGHANIQITYDTYAHVLDEMKDSASDRIAAFIFGAEK